MKKTLIILMIFIPLINSCDMTDPEMMDLLNEIKNENDALRQLINDQHADLSEEIKQLQEKTDSLFNELETSLANLEDLQELKNAIATIQTQLTQNQQAIGLLTRSLQEQDADFERILLELEELKASNEELLASMEVLLEQNNQVFFFDNGTVKCPDANVGDKGFVIGKVFEAVDRSLLFQKIEEGADLSCVCTTLVTDMSSVFASATNFNQDISTWDVSNVINMEFMFLAARRFNQHLGNWDVSNVTNMTSMFENAENFNKPIGNWKVNNVTNMSGMFFGSPFNQPIGNWDVANVNNMQSMFQFASNFNQNLSQWCVENIPFEPEDFATGSPLLDANKPVWGTCPD